eukprot:10719472-Lingulodinium_polyedra.AAC.1
MERISREDSDMTAEECLWRATAALNTQDRVRGASPAQHALGKAPILGGFDEPGRELVTATDGSESRVRSEQRR